MNDTPVESPVPITLEQLLLRDDMWMGHSNRFTVRAAVATGHDELNTALLNRGWPLASLVEVCQQGMQCEWQLFIPALLEMPGLVVLLNPPATPFSQAFFMTRSCLTVWNYVSHFSNMRVSSHFGREKRLEAIRMLAVPRSLGEQSELGFRKNAFSVCHICAPNVRRD